MGTGNDKLISIMIHIVIMILVIVLSSPMLRKRAKETTNLHKKYLIQLVRLVVIIICLVNIWGAFNPGTDIESLLIKGSALIVAIVGFAAQPAISDLIAGLLISVNKPFEIGDRIIVEGEQPGIVEDITLRHTVLRIYDDIMIIVPNSQLNTKTVTNTSYKMADRRGIHLKYSVSYDTDVARAMEVIRDCVAESPYTLSVTTNGIQQDSGPVYFLEFADSALILDTTIWVDRRTSSYTAITDVNMRVNEAFNEHGIEIPYGYLNVIGFQGVKEKTEVSKENKKRTHATRYFRTNNARVESGSMKIDTVIREAKHYGNKQGLSEREQGKLELLAEESVGIIRNLFKEPRLNVFIDGGDNMYKIHITFKPHMGSDEYKKLVSLSSKGKNEAVSGLGGKFMEIMALGLTRTSEQGKDKAYKWSLAEEQSDDSLGESILAAVADDVKISITKERVEMLVIKLVNHE